MRAIAPVAGKMMADWQKNFPAKSRLSVMETHGTADTDTLYPGNMTDTFYGPYFGTEDMIGKWANWMSLENYELSSLPIHRRGYKTDLHLY